MYQAQLLYPETQLHIQMNLLIGTGRTYHSTPTVSQLKLTIALRDQCQVVETTSSPTR
jgi:hypothetical protein